MNIIELAREAGFDPHDMSDDFTCNLKEIERFAALIREAVVAELVAGVGSRRDTSTCTAMGAGELTPHGMVINPRHRAHSTPPTSLPVLLLGSGSGALGLQMQKTKPTGLLAGKSPTQ